MNGSSHTHFYDVQNHNGDLVNDAEAYCSIECAQDEVDRLTSVNGPLCTIYGDIIDCTTPSRTNNEGDIRLKEQMQEEDTEE